MMIPLSIWQTSRARESPYFDNITLKNTSDRTAFGIEALGQPSAWIYQKLHRMCVCMCMRVYV